MTIADLVAQLALSLMIAGGVLLGFGSVVLAFMWVRAHGLALFAR